MRKSEYPKEAKTLGQRIRKKRMDLGYTLLEVAKAAQISEGYLSRIEADKQIPNSLVATRLAKKLEDDVNFYLMASLKTDLSTDILKEILKRMEKSPSTPESEVLKTILEQFLPKKTPKKLK